MSRRHFFHTGQSHLNKISNDKKEESEATGGIEKSLHWVLDIAFREDESRVRLDHADENLAVLCHISLNLLRQERSSRVGIHARRLKAGWDNQYLLRVLDGVN
jgi:predicted transposase YbfD/YdcC